NGEIFPILEPAVAAAISHGNVVEPTVATHAALHDSGVPVLLVLPDTHRWDEQVARFQRNVPQLEVRRLATAVHDLVSNAPEERSNACSMNARSKGPSPCSRMLARYDAAALLALFEPWPVIGSFSTTASASPSTSAPDGSSPTGFRTVGGKRPARIPLSSVSSTSWQRSASHGRNVSRIHLLLARCSAGAETSPQQSIGPPGTPSKTMISHSPVVVSAGK